VSSAGPGSTDPALVAASSTAAGVLIAASSPQGTLMGTAAMPAAGAAANQAASGLPALVAGPAVPASSRYAAAGTAVHRTAEGQEIVHLRRRLIPPPERFATVGREVVEPGDRMDLIAARALGDPTLFWQLCDANLAFDPAELEVPGTTLRVALPEGFPGGGGLGGG
jgi:hypothetical protein